MSCSTTATFSARSSIEYDFIGSSASSPSAGSDAMFARTRGWATSRPTSSRSSRSSRWTFAFSGSAGGSGDSGDPSWPLDCSGSSGKLELQGRPSTATGALGRFPTYSGARLCHPNFPARPPAAASTRNGTAPASECRGLALPLVVRRSTASPNARPGDIHFNQAWTLAADRYGVTGDPLPRTARWISAARGSGPAARGSTGSRGGRATRATPSPSR